MPAGDSYVFPVRVYYDDTDAGGLVYHANYLKYAERARTELLRMAGFNQSELMSDEGIAFAVRHCSADFLKPARLDDALEVHTWVLEVNAVSIGMEQAIRCAGADVVLLRVKLACIATSGGLARIPGPVRRAMEDFLNQEMARLDGS